jgi:hypothetical protein
MSNQKNITIVVSRYIFDYRIAEHISPASLKREFQGNYVSTPTTLHVLQWNILAQGAFIHQFFLK